MSVGKVASIALAAVFALGCIDGQRVDYPAYYGSPGYAPPGQLAPAPYPVPYGAAPPAASWGLVPRAPGAAYAVAFAQSRLGAPYCWGGTGPGCYDCSGLTHAAWLAGGRAIPRTSTEQASRLAPVPLQAVEPGDILWRPGHVGLYVGQGWAIAAIGRGDVVRYQKAAHFQRAVRPL
jgi:cell wall-associated NlpC family hydrolase